VERQHHEAAQFPLGLERLHGAADLVAAGHEDQQVAGRARGTTHALARGRLPDRLPLEVHGAGWYSIATGKVRPVDVSTSQGAR
jgi:hypothetical protein